MRTFMIGQYGGFNHKKYRRDFRDGFYGIEACLFEQEEDTMNLIHEATMRKFAIGIHFPLRSGISKLRDAQFLSQDQRVREQAYQLIEEELEYLSKVHPRYVLFHYPKPVLLDDRVDWSQWRFADASEYVYESKYTFEEFREQSEHLFQWLAEKGRTYNFMPVLEFDALNRYIYETGFLENLLDRYNHIKLCLDTGRLYLQETIDPRFDSRQIVRKYAKYAEILHLWNVRVKERVDYNHFPVLPELKPEDGWAPIEDYLRIIRKENSSIKILFEHRSELIRDDQLEQCYAWVNGILNG